ncbi:ABC transporter permease [Streptomyces sp. NBC_01260]|uniref:ABC transporter permease n=1 Tax=unclassified Streptomyces TaxID=2593676 RepID=UPI002252969B|nr:MULTISPECIES: ABC transporter permease [unclassified Streptomyces]MCX4772908.1 ABC transporter permease [Streptomyces sp. NBC_01285]
MFQYIVLEIRRTLRDGFFLIFGTGMPVMMYLLFTNIGGGEGVDGWKTTAMVGMAAYGALGSAMSIGTGVASDKSLGWLQQLRVTPLSSSQAVVGRAISGSVTVLPTILTVLLAGGLLNGVRLAAWQWAALVLLLWIGALPFTLLGIGNGYRLTPQGTGVVNVACLMGFAIVGGLWFPLELLPGWLRSLGGFTPANRFAELGWAATDGRAPSATTVGVLAGWLLLFGTYAVVSYRRSARTV